MNFFEYLKWKHEERKRQEKAKRIEKINEEIAMLCGEIESLKAQELILRADSRNLVFSNADQICRVVDECCKNIARKEYLLKLKELDIH